VPLAGVGFFEDRSSLFQADDYTFINDVLVWVFDLYTYAAQALFTGVGDADEALYDSSGSFGVSSR
jgi:hypothetical protein